MPDCSPPPGRAPARPPPPITAAAAAAAAAAGRARTALAGRAARRRAVAAAGALQGDIKACRCSNAIILSSHASASAASPARHACARPHLGTAHGGAVSGVRHHTRGLVDVRVSRASTDPRGSAACRAEETRRPSPRGAGPIATFSRSLRSLLAEAEPPPSARHHWNPTGVPRTCLPASQAPHSAPHTSCIHHQRAYSGGAGRDSGTPPPPPPLPPLPDRLCPPEPSATSMAAQREGPAPLEIEDSEGFDDITLLLEADQRQQRGAGWWGR